MFKYFPKQLLPKAENDYFGHLTEDSLVKYRPPTSTAVLSGRAFKGLQSHVQPFLRHDSVVLLDPYLVSLRNESFFSNDFSFSNSPLNKSVLICYTMKTQLVVKQFINVTFRDLHKFSCHLFLKSILFSHTYDCF